MVNKTFNQKPGFYGFFRLCKGKSFTHVHWVWLDFLASDFGLSGIRLRRTRLGLNPALPEATPRQVGFVFLGPEGGFVFIILYNI